MILSWFTATNRLISANSLKRSEASTRIELVYTDLQSGGSVDFAQENCKLCAKISWKYQLLTPRM